MTDAQARRKTRMSQAGSSAAFLNAPPIYYIVIVNDTHLRMLFWAGTRRWLVGVVRGVPLAPSH
jgi:hypothetical protein